MVEKGKKCDCDCDVMVVMFVLVVVVLVSLITRYVCVMCVVQKKTLPQTWDTHISISINANIIGYTHPHNISQGKNKP